MTAPLPSTDFRPIVLVVDDTPANLTLMTHALGTLYRVDVCDSGEAALARIRTGELPGIVLLDILMPGMDGYEVCQRLKQDPLTAGIPLIFLTAKGDSQDELRGFECGAVDYIVKPSPAAVVRARVRNHLMLKQAQDQLAQANRALQSQVQTLEVGLRALASMGDALGKIGGQHTLRVQRYVETLAERLGESADFAAWAQPEWRQRLSSASAMYDIGKLALPEHILQKTGPLTADERERMQTHAELGGQALQGVIDTAESELGGELTGGANVDTAEQDSLGTGPLAFLAMARDMALCHHEHWNGQGYPLGLAAEQIPPCARLVALADVYDALRTRRWHKDAWPRDEVLAYIRAGRGQQFDPAMVDAFLAVEPQWDDIWWRHTDDSERQIESLSQ